MITTGAQGLVQDIFKNLHDDTLVYSTVRQSPWVLEHGYKQYSRNYQIFLSPSLSLLLSKCLYHTCSTDHLVYFDASIHNSLNFSPASFCLHACTYECVSVYVLVQRLVQDGGGLVMEACIMHQQYISSFP